MTRWRKCVWARPMEVRKHRVNFEKASLDLWFGGVDHTGRVEKPYTEHADL